jgi:hypothetical protein
MNEIFTESSPKITFMGINNHLQREVVEETPNNTNDNYIIKHGVWEKYFNPVLIHEAKDSNIVGSHSAMQDKMNKILFVNTW